MKILVSHHIFASIKGYHTQYESNDVTDIEHNELESFSFGQTNDKDYISSLNDHPAFFIRKLSSGRWAITRVFAGPDDEYSRTTLLFHSILICQKDWIDRLGCDVQPLLSHSDLWHDIQLQEIFIELDSSFLPQPLEDKVLTLLKMVTASSSSVIVEETGCSLQILRWVFRLLTDEEKKTFTCGYRVLSNTMNLSLLCLAQQASRTGTTRRSADTRDRRIVFDTPFSQSKHKDHFISSRDHDQENKYNSYKWAIWVIISICVVGILGSIFSLIYFVNVRKEKLILQINDSASAFIENNKVFTKDPQSRKQKMDEAQKQVDQIDRFKAKSIYSEIQTSREKLAGWKDEVDRKGAVHDQLLKQAEELGRKLKKDFSYYPEKKYIENILESDKELDRSLGNLLGEGDSLYLGDINADLIEKITSERNGIKRWRTYIGTLIIDPNAITNIESTLQENDPNQYTAADPSKVNFSDPNKIPDWAVPEHFLTTAQNHVENLNVLKRTIGGFKNTPSLKNARNSPFEEHKNEADKLFSKICELEGLADQFLKDLNSLKTKAMTQSNNENYILNTTGNSIGTITRAIKLYDDLKPASITGIEKIWAYHYKLLILDYYNKNIGMNLRTKFSESLQDPKNTIKQLSVTIKRSSLGLEAIFEDLFFYNDELQGTIKKTIGK